MGLSLSLLLSAWNEILGHTIETVRRRSMSIERENGETSSTTTKSNNRSDTPSPECQERKLKTSVPLSNLVIDKKNVVSEPIASVREPVLWFSPLPIEELNVAATKVQKVYKSYRTRRNLADCAVVVEELWWKALDFAALKRSSVSFFNIDKQESAVSRWARATTRAAKVGKGLSKDEKAQKLALQHWLEAIDPRHRYGHNLHFYYDVWFNSKSTQPFFYWLDVGDGKELNLESCPKIDLQRQCIKYLGPIERQEYEVIVESGKLVYKQNGTILNTVEDRKYIFVLSTSRSLYVGQKKKGVFQHSSFLSGGATTAAGRLIARDGYLEAIWPYSGHYLPTEDNFKEFIIFLEEHHVDMTNVKKCAVEEDYNTSFKESVKESKSETAEEALPTTTDINAANVVPGTITDISSSTSHRENDTAINPANEEAASTFLLAKRLSCKWTSGVGPRIGCVRDYPVDLQARALEEVNLSPRVTPGQSRGRFPIPSPRPSPMIRVSPRLSYMGLPSPRAAVSTAN